MEKPGMIESGAGSFISLDNEELVTVQDEEVGLPPISLADTRLWVFYKNASSDEIIEATSTAERWAREMQKALLSGEMLEDIWLDSFAFVCDEMTEHCIDKAVMILSRCWQHGELLRKLHTGYARNRAYQNDTYLLFDDD